MHVIAALTLACTASCSLALPYPSELGTPETTRALCRNGVDDDEDGLTDCADPGCHGLCLEESPAACSDHLDQDGDGLVDLADPSCWPTATTSTSRCVTQRGGSWTATFGVPGDDWIATQGAPMFVSDPTGHYTTQVLQVPPPPPPGALARVTNATLVTGALDGLRATASVYLPSSGTTGVIVEIVTPTSPPAGAPSEITVSVSLGDLEAWMIVDGAPYSDFVTETQTPGWYDITITIDEAMLHAELVHADGTPAARLDVPHPMGLSAQAAYQLAVASDGSSGGGLLGAASLTRDAVFPCGPDVVVPPPPPLAAMAARSRRVTAAAADPSGRLCVLGLVGQDITAFRSDDGGRRFGPGSTVPVLAPTVAARNPCSALTWDAERSVFAGVVWTFRGLDVGFASAVTSRDCVTWTVEDVPVLATDAMACMSYSVVPPRSGSGASVHELWARTATTAGTTSLTRVTSPTPLGPDAMLTMDPPFVVPDAPIGAPVMLDVLVYGFPGDVLVVTGLSGVMHTVVVDRDMPHARDWMSQGSSQVAGSCDATALDFPFLYFSGATRGGIAHTCGEAGFFEGGATVVRTWEVTPAMP